jgi:hypothetical protein
MSFAFDVNSILSSFKIVVVFADGGSVQNTPIGSRRSLKQPSWSCTLPRKRPAVPSLSLVETRARHPCADQALHLAHLGVLMEAPSALLVGKIS